MAFACAWTSMFPPVGSGTKPSTAAPRLGINYVTASAKEATVGGVVIQQSLHALGIAGVVWNSARVLVDFIQQNPKRLAGLHVVELGAGTGAVGLAAALACSPQTMTMTDLPEVVERATQCNATQASTVHAPLKTMADQGRLVARDHCWGSPPPACIVGCDVVLCSDCLYEPSVFDKLVATLRAIAPRQVYFAYKQRHAERERAFFEAVSPWFDVTVWTTTTSPEDHLREPTSFLGEGIFICCLLPKRKREEETPEVEDA